MEYGMDHRIRNEPWNTEWIIESGMNHRIRNGEPNTECIT